MISIIVPTYNRAHILPLCLHSLVLQDFSSELFEIIIVDNNSKDNTKEVVEEFIKNNSCFSIRYKVERRPGLVFARHTGANMAKYETLVYTDDDAILSNNWLRAILEVYELNPKVVAVGTKILILWDNNPPDWVRDHEHVLGKLDYGNEIIFKKDIYINGGSFSIRKEILKSLGGFNPDQIGDLLIGDGESGLCQKIHKRNYLIGWTPHGVMQHLQFVKKNATVSDLKRRYYNNGIGVPYRLFTIEKANREILLKHSYFTLKSLFKRYLKSIKYIILRKNFKEVLNNKMELEYLRAQLVYTFHLITSASFRNYILHTNWFE